MNEKPEKQESREDNPTSNTGGAHWRGLPASWFDRIIVALIIGLGGFFIETRVELAANAEKIVNLNDEILQLRAGQTGRYTAQQAESLRIWVTDKIIKTTAQVSRMQGFMDAEHAKNG